MMHLPPRSTLFPYTTLFRSLLSMALPTLVAFQLMLGAATYVAKYAFPTWLDQFSFAANYVVQEKDRKSTRLNSSHVKISYAVFCLKKKTTHNQTHQLCTYAQ